MNQVTPAEIRVAGEYDHVRDAERRSLADLKSHRRVVIDDTVVLVFENHETIRGVVEEVVRTEHIRGFEQITSEVEQFNALVPEAGHLSACLYLEVADAADMAAQAQRLAGVEQSIYIEAAGRRCTADSEQLDLEAGAPAMYHLRFALPDAIRQAWLDGDAVSLGCDHAACSARVLLRDDQRDALAADLVR